MLKLPVPLLLSAEEKKVPGCERIGKLNILKWTIFGLQYIYIYIYFFHVL